MKEFEVEAKMIMVEQYIHSNQDGILMAVHKGFEALVRGPHALSMEQLFTIFTGTADADPYLKIAEESVKISRTLNGKLPKSKELSMEELSGPAITCSVAMVALIAAQGCMAQRADFDKVGPSGADLDSILKNARVSERENLE